MIDSIEAALGIYLASLIVGVLSALIPIINAELYLIGVVLLTGSVPAAIALGLLVGLGQMIVKVGLYEGAKRAGEAGRKRNAKWAAQLERARVRVDQWRSKTWLTFVSAVVGIPPFYIITLLAGALQVRFRTFLALGILGRSIRFVAIALITLLL